MIKNNGYDNVNQNIKYECLAYHRFNQILRQHAIAHEGSTTRMYPVMHAGGFTEALNNMPAYIEELIEPNDLQRSGLVLVGINSIIVKVNRYTPFTGPSYIDLPTEIFF